MNKKPYLHHTKPLFFHSEITKLDDICKFKICDYLYKNNLTISFNREHSHNRRFRNHLLPVFQRLSSSQRSVKFVGPNIWNNLPPEIKESPSIHILKRRLKTILYFIIRNFAVNFLGPLKFRHGNLPVMVMYGGTFPEFC